MNTTLPTALLAAVASLGLLTTTTPADARPAHHTARVTPPDRTVDRIELRTVFATTVTDPVGGAQPAVRFWLNNGSSWLSPDPSCLGRRPRMCRAAWTALRNPGPTEAAQR